MALPVKRNQADVTRWDPVTELSGLTHRLARLFDEQGSEFLLGAEGFTPRADLEETDDSYVLEVELPGVKKKDINIEVFGRRLVISGERPEHERSGWLRRQTRAWGRFRYEVTLPESVDEQGVEARLRDGVLHVRVGKSTSGQRRRIEVK